MASQTCENAVVVVALLIETRCPKYSTEHRDQHLQRGENIRFACSDDNVFLLQRLRAFTQARFAAQ